MAISPVRSIRINERIWELAKTRAMSEGTSISKVVSDLVVGYAEHKIDAPKTITVYPKS